MLSAADRDLVRRDPALSGLAMVLDPETFLTMLRRRLPDAGILSAQLNYVKYRPHRYCRVGYCLHIHSGTLTVYASAYSSDAPELGSAHADAGVPSAWGPGRIVLDDEATVVSVFPNDDGLPALARHADVNAHRHLLRDVYPGRPDLWAGRMETIRYRPERRYVARLIGEHGTGAVLKWYTEREYPIALSNTMSFCSNGRFRIPRRLGSSDHDRVIAVEWLPGDMMEDVLTAPKQDLAAVRHSAEALADCHSDDPAETLSRTCEREFAAMDSAADGVGFVLPGLRLHAHELMRQLIDLRQSHPASDCPVHGDFSPRQVVVGADGVGFVDFDDAGRGDPAMDLGYFLASLERLVLLGRMAPARMEAVSKTFLAAYESATGFRTPQTTGWYVASGLFRKLLHPFRQRAPDWPRAIEAMLARIGVIVRQESYEPAN